MSSENYNRIVIKISIIFFSKQILQKFFQTHSHFHKRYAPPQAGNELLRKQSPKFPEGVSMMLKASRMNSSLKIKSFMTNLNLFKLL